MKINFADIDMYDRPILILKRADGTPIGVLGYAKNIEIDPNYNELSTLSFTLPAFVDGKSTPYYDMLTGQKIIELKGIAQFATYDPEESGDSMHKCKTIQARSLECEFARKDISLSESTYKFFDELNPDGTVLGMIMEQMPAWHVGTVASAICNKYRTFQVDSDNIYNFIKGTVQKTYNCIFEFDTLTRTVDVRNADDTPAEKQVYITRENLAKDIKVTEQPEDLVTRLGVYGADGVDIRDVNPTGSNSIINLDYFMTPDNFDPALIAKYNAWKQLVEDDRRPFYNYSIQYSSYVVEEITENARLDDLRGELTSLENVQAVIIQGIASGQKRQTDLDNINSQITAKQAEIVAKQAQIDAIIAEKNAIMNSMVAIRNQCAWERYFTGPERLAMDAYIYDNSINDPSFVASDVQSYSDGIGNVLQNKSVSVTGTTVERVTTAGGSTLYDMKGGLIDIAQIVSGTVISSVFEQRQNGKVVLSMYINNGSYSGTSFPSGCVSISGTGTVTQSGNDITCNITSGYLYFSLNASDYEKKMVAWELYDYGYNLLKKMSVPSYSFSVDSANFIALEPFTQFKNELELGQRVYVGLDEGRVLKPICIGAKIRFDDRPYLELIFNDTFTANDGKAKLVDILDKSISMGKVLSAGKFTYEAWMESGASTKLREFMTSSLDTAKNAIMSSSDQAVTWDGAGLRLRKYRNTSRTAYEPEQIWINNNSIMMTDSSWATAKLAIGKIHDPNVGDKWGIIADSVVGTLLAGESLVIESQKKDGGTAVFRMDSQGCRLYNSEFSVQKTNANNTTTQVVIDPEVGIVAGTYPVKKQDGSIDTSNAKFYVDTDGNMHLEGTIETAVGKIGGWTISTDGLLSGATNGTRVGLASTGDIRIWAGNLDKTKAPFYVKQDGTIYATLGQIGGWFLGSDYIGNANKKSESTTGMASGTNAATWTFWAGGAQASAAFRVRADGKVYASNMEIAGGSIVIKDGDTTMFKVTSAGKVTAADMNITGGSITIKKDGVTKFSVSSAGKVSINDGSITIKSGDTTTFSVTDAGYLTSISGKIGGWFIGSDYLGNKNTRGNSTVGLFSTEGNNNVNIWAGGGQATAPFRVTGAGKVYASDIEISGGKIGGWFIGADYIGNANTMNGSMVGMSSGTSADTSIVFWAGNYDPHNAHASSDPATSAFRVLKDGTVYSSALNITGGSIQISDGSTVKFKVTNKGAVTAENLTINGGSIALGSTFSVTSAGYLTATSGKVGGWFIGSDYIGDKSTKATSTVGLVNTTGTNKVFWAGGTTPKFYVQADGKVYATNLELAGGSINIKNSNNTTIFSVSSAGVLTAKSGSVGGWYFLTDYLGNASTKANSTVGMAPVASTSTDSAFWAGGAQASATFRVTGKGKLYATDAEITGAITATSLKIGDKNVDEYVLSVSPKKLSLMTWDSLGSASKILLKPDQIKITTSGTFELDSTNTKIKSDGELTTTKGKIGGWSIGETRLSSGSGATYVALDSNSQGTYAIWCGNDTDSKAPFRVTRKGDVYINSLKVYNGSSWDTIDFSGNFSNAVSLKSGGSWSGNSFTATVSLWGKINKSISISAAVSVKSIGIDTSMANDQNAVVNIVLDQSVNGNVRSVNSTYSQLNVSAISLKGWVKAAGKISYTAGAKKVTIPKAGEYDGTASLDISKTYDAGYDSGKSDYRPGSITQDTSNKTITVISDSGDSLGTYSVATTWNAGYNSADFSNKGSWANGNRTITLNNGKSTIVSMPVSGTWSFGDSVVSVVAGGRTYSASVDSKYYNNGYNAGYSAGYDEGKSDGDTAGYNRGYKAGWNACRNAASRVTATLYTGTVSSVMIQGVGRRNVLSPYSRYNTAVYTLPAAK